MHNLLGALDIMDEFLIDNERFISFLPLILMKEWLVYIFHFIVARFLYINGKIIK